MLPELEHYATIWYDEDGSDNSDLIDAGLYLNYGPEDTLDREQSINLEEIQDSINKNEEKTKEIDRVLLAFHKELGL